MADERLHGAVASILDVRLGHRPMGVFVGVMPAWLVVMLGLGQHSEAAVAWHRAVFTVLGGFLAMAV